MQTIYSATKWDYNDAGVYSAGYGVNRSYSKHDAMLYSDGQYYYAKNNIAAGTPFSTSRWGGVRVKSDSSKKGEFLWFPSYNSNVNVTPRINIIQFGDGYQQRAKDGLNAILLPFDYTFSERKLDEAVAILHFLHQRQGKESFYFTPPGPFGVLKLFICKEWSHSSIFQDNHTIRAKFEEVVN